MKSSRRQFNQFILSGAALALPGCDFFQKDPCLLRYANCTGRFLQCIFSVGDIISDLMSGASLISLESSARISIVSGQNITVRCQDFFTSEIFEVAGTIPTAPKHIQFPACEIKLTEDLELKIQWTDVINEFTYDSIHRDFSNERRTVPLLFIGNPEVKNCEFGLRQRPSLFSCVGMSKLDTEFKINSHAICRWILSPQDSPEAVVTYAASNGPWARPHYRCLIDFHKTPHHKNPNDGVWIEMLDNENLSIGRFSTDLHRFDKIQKAYLDGELTAPNETVSFKAQRQPVFIADLKTTRFSMELPDLRFDDEIEAQGLESPVPPS